MVKDSQMRHVVQVGKYYPPYYGGIPGYIQLLSEGLKGHYRVTVLVANTSWQKTEERDEDLHIIRVPRMMELRSTAICPTLPGELRKLQPDLVHLHFPDPMAHLAFLRSGINTKLVVSWHGDITRQEFLLHFYRRPLRKILESADAVIAGSPPFRDGSRILADVRSKCTVIPYGIDLASYSMTEAIRTHVEKLKPAYGERIVLFVGRLVHYKGLEFLLEAMRGVDACLVIIGTGYLESELRAQAERLGILDRVKIWGGASPSDLVAHLHACALLVLPSINESESFGLVQLEAMACRKPVVSTNLATGVPWVNQDGRTGFVVPPRDVAALRRAIQQILDNPGLRREFGEAGWRRVESEFTGELHMRRVLELYEGVLCGSGARGILRGGGEVTVAPGEPGMDSRLPAPPMMARGEQRPAISGGGSRALRIAFLTARLPYPPMGGDRLRPYYFLKHLLRGHHVTLYAIRSPLQKQLDFDSPDLAGLQQRLFTISSLGYGWNALKGLISNLPLQVNLYEDPDLKRVLAEDVKSGKIDLIVVHLARMAEYARPFRTVPKILDMVDSLCLHYSRMPPKPRWNPRWAAARFDRERICRYEPTLPGDFDSVLLSSPVDLEAVRSRSKAKNLVLVPNGVDLEKHAFNEGPFDPNRIVFFGKLDYLPNSDAAIYFTTEILPLVKKRIPKASFVIAGWNPTDGVRALGRRDGVTVEANIRDVRAVVACSAVSVAPLRFGAGTQYKILESLAMGVPVVATVNAARGFMGTDAKLPILVASRPSEFAERVVQVMTDTTYRDQFRREGRSMVEAHYGWDQVLSPLDALLAAIERRPGLSDASRSQPRQSVPSRENLSKGAAVE